MAGSSSSSSSSSGGGGGESRDTARAVYFTGPESVEVREVDLDEHRSGVRVTSELIGVSHGSELVVYHGYAPTTVEEEPLETISGDHSFPLKYGYMNVGRTEDGGRVFAFYPHQDCFHCRRDQLLDLPEEMPADDAIFLPSLETAVSIVHDTAPRLGETVLLFGQGIVGLLVAELLRRCRLEQLITVEPLEARRQRSRSLGCICLDPDSDDIGTRVMEATAGRGADRTINLSASADALQLALENTAYEGTLVEASWYGSRPVEVVLGTTFHRKRLTLKSSQVSHIPAELQPRWTKRRRFELVLELLDELRPSRYITHRYPLDRAPEAFQLLAERPGEVLQLVLEP